MARPGPKLGWDIDRAIKLYQGGATLTDLAKIFGVSHQAISQAFRFRGIGRPPRGRVLSWDVDKGAEMYRAGASLAQVAAAFGISAPSVFHAFKRRGIERRGRGRPAQPPRQPLLDHLSNRSQSVHADRIYEPAHEIISNPHEGVSP